MITENFLNAFDYARLADLDIRAFLMFEEFVDRWKTLVPPDISVNYYKMPQYNKNVVTIGLTFQANFLSGKVQRQMEVPAGVFTRVDLWDEFIHDEMGKLYEEHGRNEMVRAGNNTRIGTSSVGPGLAVAV